MGSNRPEKRLQKLIDKFRDLDLNMKLVVTSGANLGIEIDGEELELSGEGQEEALKLAAGEISDRLAASFAKILAKHVKDAIEQSDADSEDSDDEDVEFRYTKEEVLARLNAFIRDRLGDFSFDAGRIERISEKAAMEGTRIRRELDLTDEDVLRLATISLYKIVFLCDDSASMRMGQRIPALIRTLQSVTEWATRLEPNGVSLRFLNFKGDMDGRFDGLTSQLKIADMVEEINLGSQTMLGTMLKDKILQYMAGKGSPLIVVIITDGEPQGEPKDCLRNSILDCNSMLKERKQMGGAVFIMLQVGKSAKAQAFLKDLEDDEALDGLVYRSGEPVDAVLKRLKRPLNNVHDEVGKNYKKYKKHLLEQFTIAVMGKDEDS
ncbi:hypothetical protein GQ44DRAFT_725947 [Phaeosphaeriaceae sp. PMI808]|nr:hypothetical protein GQ44DRAFT_725947 [Phaeosphaeriaceae sp. PMI808]